MTLALGVVPMKLWVSLATGLLGALAAIPTSVAKERMATATWMRVWLVVFIWQLLVWVGCDDETKLRRRRPELCGVLCVPRANLRRAKCELRRNVMHVTSTVRRVLRPKQR